jgi:hypothetical protein
MLPVYAPRERLCRRAKSRKLATQGIAPRRDDLLCAVIANFL